MTKRSPARVLLWIIAVLPIVIVAAFYSRLPDTVAYNWSINGVVSYTVKSYLWIVSAIPIGLAVLFRLLPRIDPRRESYGRFQSAYDAMCVAILLVFLALVGIVLIESFAPGSIEIGNVITGIVGILLVVLGNIMPKFKSNFFAGIKTPWTLSSTEVWNCTHRLGGYCFFIAGLILFVMAFILRDLALFIALLVVVLAAAIIPIIMSYVWYKRLQT